MLKALLRHHRVAFGETSSVAALQQFFPFQLGITTRPKTPGSGPLLLRSAVGAGGFGGAGGALGSGGAGSGASAGQWIVDNTLLDGTSGTVLEPDDTVSYEFELGLLGSAGVQAGTTYIRAVRSGGAKVVLATLLGGLPGATSVAGAGTAGANSQRGLLTGGAAPTTAGARGGDGNSQAAMDGTAGPLKDGASGGSGGKYFATRTTSETGRGGQGGYTGGAPTGIPAQGDDNGADGGGGGNSLAHTWTNGADGSSSAYKPAVTYAPIVVSKNGGGAPGAPTGQLGRKGGLPLILAEETPGANPGLAYLETRMFAGSRTFSRYFCGTTEAGWPGPAGGFGANNTPTYAAYLHRLRTMSWEWSPNQSTTRGAGGAWQSIEKSDGSYYWTWLDARLAAAATNDCRVIMNTYGVSEFHTAFNSAPYAEPDGSYGAACRCNSLSAQADFWTALAGRPNAAQITDLELGNEPSTRPSFFNEAGNMTMPHYVDLAYTAATAFLAVRPGTQLWLPGWIGESDGVAGARELLNTPGEVNTGWTFLRMMKDLGAGWSSHPYETTPNELAGNGQATKPFVRTQSGAMLVAMEEFLAAGGTNFKWAPNEFGFPGLFASMTHRQRCWHVLECYLDAFEQGASFVNAFRVSDNPWFGPTAGESQLVAHDVMQYLAGNLYDKTVTQAMQRNDADRTRVYQLSTGISLTMNSTLF